MTITIDVAKGGAYALEDYRLQSEVVSEFYRMSCQALALVLLRFELVAVGFTEDGADKVVVDLSEADRRRASRFVERTVDSAPYVHIMRGGTWDA